MDQDPQDSDNLEVRPLARRNLPAALASLWSNIESERSVNDIDTQISMLSNLMLVASRHGRFDYQLRAYGEMKRLYKLTPRHAGLRDSVLWYYKWVAEHLGEHSDISLASIESLFDDMETVYKHERESLKPVLKCRCINAMLTGRPEEEIDEYFRQWDRTRRGGSSDCPACDIEFRVDYHARRDEDEKAIAIAGGLLTGKVRSCDDTPALMAKLISSAMAVDNYELAAALGADSTRIIRRRPSMARHLRHGVLLHAMTRQFVRGHRTTLVALHHANEPCGDFSKFSIYVGAATFAVIALIHEPRAQAFPARLIPGAGNVGAVSLPAAIDLLLSAARDAGARLDRRNGTPTYTDAVDKAEASIGRMLEDGDAPA